MGHRHTTRGSKHGPSGQEDNWQQRTDMFVLDMTEEYKAFPTVTANDLRSRRERPRKVKMLMRDFIEGLPLPLPYSRPMPPLVNSVQPSV